MFLSDYSTAINTVSDYLKMWSDLFNVLYIFIIGSLPWVAIVWFTFFISIYILVKNYKEKENSEKRKINMIIGIGNDIVTIKRIENSLKKFGDKF